MADLARTEYLPRLDGEASARGHADTTEVEDDRGVVVDEQPTGMLGAVQLDSSGTHRGLEVERSSHKAMSPRRRRGT